MDATLDPNSKARHGVWWVLAVLVSSALFSIGLFVWQVANDTEQRSGKVASVTSTTLTIVDGRGRTSVIKLTPDTEVRGRTATLIPGQFVHVVGVVREGGTVIGESIYVVEQRPPKVDDTPRTDTRDQF